MALIYLPIHITQTCSSKAELTYIHLSSSQSSVPHFWKKTVDYANQKGKSNLICELFREDILSAQSHPFLWPAVLVPQISHDTFGWWVQITSTFFTGRKTFLAAKPNVVWDLPSELISLSSHIEMADSDSSPVQEQNVDEPSTSEWDLPVQISSSSSLFSFTQKEWKNQIKRL